MFRLPECNSVPACPMCAAPVSEFATVRYHPCAPMAENPPPPCNHLVLCTPTQELEGFDRHLCRVCRRCGFGWVEQVAEAGSIYEQGEPEA